MRPEINEKLNALLSDASFFEEHKDLAEPDAVIKAIQAKIPEATYEEVDAYMAQLSASAQKSEELSEDSLEQVAGGIVITCTVIGCAIACVGAAAAGGAAIGATCWYWKNRNR